MLILQSAAPLIARVLLAIVLVIGSPVSAGIAVDGHAAHRESGHVMAGMPDHGCCHEDSSAADRTCALACALAACGSTVLPVTAWWAVKESARGRWPLREACIPTGIAVDPATPPPRA